MKQELGDDRRTGGAGVRPRFRAPLDPALGGIASSRSGVPEAERVCRSSYQNPPVSLACLHGARGRTPSRSRPEPPPFSAPYVYAHARSRPGVSPDPSAGRDRVLAIRRPRSQTRLSIQLSESACKLGTSTRRARPRALLAPDHVPRGTCYPVHVQAEAQSHL